MGARQAVPMAGERVHAMAAMSADYVRGTAASSAAAGAGWREEHWDSKRELMMVDGMVARRESYSAASSAAKMAVWMGCRAAAVTAALSGG